MTRRNTLALASDAAPTALRIRVRGVVQGVGFRPFVHRLALELGLAGSVANDGEGVDIVIGGTCAQRFLERLKSTPPPLARIETVSVEPWDGRLPGPGFTIRQTQEGTASGALIPADIAPCAACLAEFCDPRNRRFGYVFTSCTDCGPRYTITRALPFDRERTAMAAFPMCEACDAEYRDPTSRRFHSQTNCCASCGPRLSHSVADVAAVLAQGGIVALKGLGGFHLACDATDATAVAQLRARKRRDAKPLAVMARDAAQARRLATIRDAEMAFLESRERPILIAPSRPGNGVAPDVSAGLSTLGVMLPSTLLQQAVVDALCGRPMVMTSGNLSGEPVITDNAEAVEALGRIADLVVTHDRMIEARADDSVIRILNGAPARIRRARGIAPAAIRLGSGGPDVLAFGGHLKVAACLATGRDAFLSPHVGDLDHPSAVAALDSAARHLITLTGAKPVAVAHDRHPDFASTRLAERFGLRCIPVQHHHAHALAVAAEHGAERSKLIALTLDGFGLGDRHEAWGGEVLAVEGARCERVAHLGLLAEPGGDKAAREPWRMAAAVLAALGRSDEINSRFAGETAAATVAAMLGVSGLCKTTTSAGRWFDAAAALSGVALKNRHEGDAAMRFEALCDAPEALPGGWRRDGMAIDLLPVMADIAMTEDPRRASNRFHGTMIAALAEAVRMEAEKTGASIVVLGGGCFVNRPLAEGVAAALKGIGLRPLMARDAPANDGGLALGQVVAARLVLEGEN